MNWKLIGKYTGFVVLAIIIIGLIFGLLEFLLLQAGLGIRLGMIFVLIAIVIIFARMTIEQKSHTFAHAFAVCMLFWLILQPINLGLLHHSFAEGTLFFISISILAVIGIAIGKMFGSGGKEAILPVRNEVDKNNQNTYIAADTIVFCPYCRKNNRLPKGVLVGIKPVCANCKSPLELKEPLRDSIDDEYIDVEPDEPRIIETTVTVIEPPSMNDNKIPNSVSRKTSVDSTHEQINQEDLASEELKQELFKLLSNNKEEADRIVGIKRNKYPGHSDRWYWEKAIEDDKRLRR